MVAEKAPCLLFLHDPTARPNSRQFIGSVCETASASHPRGGLDIGASPALAINRAVLSSGGIPCQIIATIWEVLGMAVCL
jgi:hypothetical protein